MKVKAEFFGSYTKEIELPEETIARFANDKQTDEDFELVWELGEKDLPKGLYVDVFGALSYENDKVICEF